MTNSYVISVSLGTGCYRHVQIAASATLFQLHKIILSAFRFEDDHAHAFFMDNHIWSPVAPFFSMKMHGDEKLTTQYTLKRIKLAKGDKFKYLFDFGADWCFQCKVLRELEERTDIPGVIRSVGDAPEQYPDFGEEEEGAWTPQIYKQERIEELYQQLSVPQPVVSLVRRYCEAASHLYGIVPLGVVLDIYNQQNPTIPKEDFLQITEIMRHEANDFVILGAETMYCNAPVACPIDREIISLAILECGLDEYDRLAGMQQGKDYVVLPKEFFLDYEDEDFFPQTPQSEAMLRFLKKRAGRALISAKDALDAIHLLIWLDAPVEAALEGLVESGFPLKSNHEIAEFLKLFQELNNHTGKIANRGQTPEELAANRQRAKQEQKAAKTAEKNADQISMWDEDK